VSNLEAEEKQVLKQVDHIGIVVRNLDQSLESYERLFRVRAAHIGIMEELSLRVAFIPVGEVMLELLEPLVLGKGRLGELLQKHGEGIDHIAYRIDNLDEVLAEMKENGVKLRDEKPRAGAEGSRIAFINPEETNDVLIELVERRDNEHTGAP